jgi:phosphoenolpyruvate carboxykinase (ATP)
VLLARNAIHQPRRLALQTTPAPPPTPPPPKTQQQQALAHEKDTILTETGALAARSGAKTGRSPRDKRVVREPSTEKDVWWAGGDAGGAGGSPNFEMDER